MVLQWWPLPCHAAGTSLPTLFPLATPSAGRRTARPLLLPPTALAASLPVRTAVAPPLPALAALLGRLHDIEARLDGNQIEAHRRANGPQEQGQKDEEGESVDEVDHVAAQEGATGIEGVVKGSALGGGIPELGLHGGAAAGQVGLQATAIRNALINKHTK